MAGAIRWDWTETGAPSVDVARGPYRRVHPEELIRFTDDRPEDPAVAGHVIEAAGHHHAARTARLDHQLGVTDPDRPADPRLLGECVAGIRDVDQHVRSEAPKVDPGPGRQPLDRVERLLGQEQQRKRIEVGPERRLELEDLGREHRQVGQRLVLGSTEDAPKLLEEVVRVRSAPAIVLGVGGRPERVKRDLVVERGAEPGVDVVVGRIDGGSIGQSDPDGRRSAHRDGLGQVRGRQAHQLADLLRAADPAPHLVANRPPPVADQPAGTDLGHVQLLAHHRLGRIAPQLGHRRIHRRTVPPSTRSRSAQSPFCDAERSPQRAFRIRNGNAQSRTGIHSGVRGSL